MMEAGGASETSVYSYQNTRRCTSKVTWLSSDIFSLYFDGTKWVQKAKQFWNLLSRVSYFRFRVNCPCYLNTGKKFWPEFSVGINGCWRCISAPWCGSVRPQNDFVLRHAKLLRVSDPQSPFLVISIANWDLTPSAYNGCYQNFEPKRIVLIVYTKMD